MILILVLESAVGQERVGGTWRKGTRPTEAGAWEVRLGEPPPGHPPPN